MRLWLFIFGEDSLDVDDDLLIDAPALPARLFLEALKQVSVYAYCLAGFCAVHAHIISVLHSFCNTKYCTLSLTLHSIATIMCIDECNRGADMSIELIKGEILRLLGEPKQWGDFSRMAEVEGFDAALEFVACIATRGKERRKAREAARLISAEVSQKEVA